MHGQLDVDLDVFERFALGLDDMRVRSDRSTSFMRYVASHVGHPGLADDLRDHGDQWGESRARLSAALGQLADGMRAIHDEFAAIDVDLASTLQTGGGFPHHSYGGDLAGDPAPVARGRRPGLTGTPDTMERQVAEGVGGVESVTFNDS